MDPEDENEEVPEIASDPEPTPSPRAPAPEPDPEPTPEQPPPAATAAEPGEKKWYAYQDPDIPQKKWMPYQEPDEGPGHAFAREIASGVGPAAGGAALGAVTGSTVGAFTANPVAVIGGGLVGAVAGGYGVDVVQEAAKRAAGYDDSAIRRANETAYPWATYGGKAVSNIAGGAAGFGKAVVSGGARIVGGLMGAGWETGVAAHEGKTPREAFPAIASAAAGGALWAGGRPWTRAGERVGAQFGKAARPYFTFPEPPPPPPPPPPPVTQPGVRNRDWTGPPQDVPQATGFQQGQLPGIGDVQPNLPGMESQPPPLPGQQPRLPGEHEPGLPFERKTIDAEGQYGFDITAPDPRNASRNGMPPTSGVSGTPAPPATGAEPKTNTGYAKEGSFPEARPWANEREERPHSVVGQGIMAAADEVPPRQAAGINVIQAGQVDPTLAAAHGSIPRTPVEPNAPQRPPPGPPGPPQPPRAPAPPIERRGVQNPDWQGPPAPIPRNQQVMVRPPDTTQGVLVEPPVRPDRVRLYRTDPQAPRAFTTDRAAAQQFGPLRHVDVNRGELTAQFRPGRDQGSYVAHPIWEQPAYQRRVQPTMQPRTQPTQRRWPEQRPPPPGEPPPPKGGPPVEPWDNVVARTAAEDKAEAENLRRWALGEPQISSPVRPTPPPARGGPGPAGRPPGGPRVADPRLDAAVARAVGQPPPGGAPRSSGSPRGPRRAAPSAGMTNQHPPHSFGWANWYLNHKGAIAADAHKHGLPPTQFEAYLKNIVNRGPEAGPAPGSPPARAAAAEAPKVDKVAASVQRSRKAADKVNAREAAREAAPPQSPRGRGKVDVEARKAKNDEFSKWLDEEAKKPGSKAEEFRSLHAGDRDAMAKGGWERRNKLLDELNAEFEQRKPAEPAKPDYAAEAQARHDTARARHEKEYAGLTDQQKKFYDASASPKGGYPGLTHDAHMDIARMAKSVKEAQAMANELAKPENIAAVNKARNPELYPDRSAPKAEPEKLPARSEPATGPHIDALQKEFDKAKKAYDKKGYKSDKETIDRYNAAQEALFDAKYRYEGPTPKAEPPAAAAAKAVRPKKANKKAGEQRTLYDHIREMGGLIPTPEVKEALKDFPNRLHLIRSKAKGGRTIDEVWESVAKGAPEERYINDPGANDPARQPDTDANEILRMIAGDGGKKHLPLGEVPKGDEARIDAENAAHAERAVDNEKAVDEFLADPDRDLADFQEGDRQRMYDIMEEGMSDPAKAYEQAIKERDAQREFEGDVGEPKELADIPDDVGKVRPAADKGADNKPQENMFTPEQTGESKTAQRGAAAPLKPKAAQKGMDEGLFGDTDKQTDFASKTEEDPDASLRKFQSMSEAALKGLGRDASGGMTNEQALERAIANSAKRKPQEIPAEQGTKIPKRQVEPIKESKTYTPSRDLRETKEIKPDLTAAEHEKRLDELAAAMPAKDAPKEEMTAWRREFSAASRSAAKAADREALAARAAEARRRANEAEEHGPLPDERLTLDEFEKRVPAKVKEQDPNAGAIRIDSKIIDVAEAIKTKFPSLAEDIDELVRNMRAANTNRDVEALLDNIDQKVDFIAKNGGSTKEIKQLQEILNKTYDDMDRPWLERMNDMSENESKYRLYKETFDSFTEPGANWRKRWSVEDMIKDLEDYKPYSTPESHQPAQRLAYDHAAAKLREEVDAAWKPDAEPAPKAAPKTYPETEAFAQAQKDYRAKKIGDDEFLAAKAKYEAWLKETGDKGRPKEPARAESIAATAEKHGGLDKATDALEAKLAERVKAIEEGTAEPAKFPGLQRLAMTRKDMDAKRASAKNNKPQVVATDKFGNEAKFTGATVHEAAVFARGAGYKPDQIKLLSGAPYVPPKNAAQTPAQTPATPAQTPTAATVPPGGGGQPPGGAGTPPAGGTPQPPRGPASSVEAAEKSILSHVAKEVPWYKKIPTSKAEAKALWRAFYTQAKNAMDPFDQTRKMIERETGQRLSAEDDFAQLARLTKGLGGRFKQIMQFGTYDINTGKVNGKSLDEVIKPVNDNPDGFTAYAMAKRVIELEGRGIKTGINLAEANQVVAARAGTFEPVFRDLHAFQDRVLENLVKSGVLSDAAAAKMRQMNKEYVPFYRMLSPDSELGQQLGSGLQTRNPIFRIKGSDKDIFDPITSIIKNTYVFTDLAHRNQVITAMKRANDLMPADKQFMVRDRSSHPIEVQPQEIQKFLDAHGIEGFADDAMTIFRPNAFRPADDKIRLYNNGKAEVYTVPKDIGTAVNALDKESMGLFLKIAATPASLLRAGAVFSPEFIVRNPLRDLLSAFIQAKHGSIPVYDFAIGLTHILKKSKDFQEWMIAGGANANLVSMDRAMLHTDPMSMRVANKVVNPKQWLKMLQDISELSENATRMGVYSRARGKGISRGESAFSSREATLDFARTGASSAARALNATIPFFNAQVEGVDQAARAFRDNKMGFLVKAGVGITMPSVLLWFKNQGDERVKELPSWQKDLFWIVPGSDKWVPVDEKDAAKWAGKDLSKLTHTVRQGPNGLERNDATIWRVPKPFEVGVLFGSVPERLLDAYYDHNPNAFKNLGNTMMQALTPSVVPQAVLPVIEQWANKSIFLDRSLETEEMRKKSPAQRYGPYTSETAKAIGSVVRTVAGEKSSFGSPIMIDNYIRQWTGGLGKHVVDLIDAGLKSQQNRPPEPAKGLADTPGIKAFVARFPSQSAQSIQDFYDTRTENKMNAADIKGLRKTDPAAAAERRAGANVYTGEGFAKQLKADRDAIKRIAADKNMSPDQKRAAMDLTYLLMIEHAKAGNAAFERNKRRAPDATR